MLAPRLSKNIKKNAMNVKSRTIYQKMTIVILTMLVLPLTLLQRNPPSNPNLKRGNAPALRISNLVLHFVPHKPMLPQRGPVSNPNAHPENLFTHVLSHISITKKSVYCHVYAFANSYLLVLFLVQSRGDRTKPTGDKNAVTPGHKSLSNLG